MIDGDPAMAPPTGHGVGSSSMVAAEPLPSPELVTVVDRVNETLETFLEARR